MENIRARTRKLAVLGLMLAMISALSFLEHMLPPLPFLPPNVRLGLSNIVTMYALFFMGRRSAIALTVLKSIFVVLMRGVVAGFLSLLGGGLSIAVIILLSAIFREHISFLILSIAGAIFHNVGQILGATLILGGGNRLMFFVAYMPVMIVFGVMMGAVTGTLLRVVMPLFHRVLGKQK